MSNYAHELINSAERVAESELFLASVFQLADSEYRTLGNVGRNAITAAVRRPQFSNIQDAATWLGGGMEFTDYGADLSETNMSQFATKALVNACLVDRIKVKTVGHDSNNHASNVLMTKANGLLALHAANYFYHDYAAASGQFVGYRSLALDVFMLDEPILSWMALKWDSFNERAQEALELFKQFDSYDRLSEKEALVLRNENDQLWREMLVFKKYGVKSAVAPSISDAYISEWIVQDVQEATGYSKHDPRIILGCGKVAARFMGTPDHYKSSKYTLTPIQGERSHTNTTYVHHNELFDESISPGEARLCPLNLLDDGEITTAEGVSLKKVCEQMGISDSYELLRSEMLSIYFDLVTPVYVHDLAVPDKSSTTGTNTREEVGGLLRNLVIARQRVLKELGPDIIAQIEEDQHQAEIEETKSRSMVMHEVIGFIRTLPKGYRASETARTQCREDLGVVLSEYGETYVRPHIRGNIKEESPKGHKVKYVYGKSTSNKRNQRSKKR